MRKLTALGVTLAGALGVALQAGAATTINDIENGFEGAVEQSCTWIVQNFTSFDCTYGGQRPGLLPKWIGPARQGGYYVRGGPEDDISYDSNTGPTNPGVPDNAKVTPPVTGTVTIDDAGTPSDGSDDTIAMNFTIGRIARLISTGQFTRAIQRWDSMVHTVAAYPVDAATPNVDGGFDYILGSRGDEPIRLCNKNDANDCFPSNNSFTSLPTVTFWAPTQVDAIGVERSINLATTSAPNIGATSTASFTNYNCVTNNGAVNDCAASVLVWSTGPGTGAEPAGYDNIVGRISTNSAGDIVSALLYWSEEFNIGAFGGVGDNSNQMGTIEFTGRVQGTAPEARDDEFTVIEDSIDNNFDVLGNDRNFDLPLTNFQVGDQEGGGLPSEGGTATAQPDNTIDYTPPPGFTGSEFFVYSWNDADSDFAEGIVTVTVVPNVIPVAPDGGVTTNTQGVAPGATSTRGIINVATALAGYSPGNAPATVTVTGAPTSGTTSVSGTTITYTPNTGFFAGTDSYVYTVTDVNGDTDTGTITITNTDVTPALGDGDVEVDAGDSDTVNLALTPGNGSVGQHTVTVTSQASNGTCAVTGATASAVTVEFEADSGVSGDDSCVLTITDGDGDTDTATVTIFINDVGIVLPSGSAMDPWTLGLLGLLPLLRGRRRR